MPRSRAPKPDALIEPWQEFDWSRNGPYGAAPFIRDPAPCVICKKPSHLLSPKRQQPCHKVCAERYYLVSALAPILVALGQAPPAT